MHLDAKKRKRELMYRSAAAADHAAISTIALMICGIYQNVRTDCLA